ncbi:MAG: hypothetical protein ACR2NG_02125 [Acidimicrobiia bacterium]
MVVVVVDVVVVGDVEVVVSAWVVVEDDSGAVADVVVCGGSLVVEDDAASVSLPAQAPASTTRQRIDAIAPRIRTPPVDIVAPHRPTGKPGRFGEAVDSHGYRRDNQYMSEEKDLTRKQRIAVSAIAWLVAVPFVIGMFFLNIWLGLICAAVVLFTTWDYVRKGKFSGGVEDSKYGFG